MTEIQRMRKELDEMIARDKAKRKPQSAGEGFNVQCYANICDVANVILYCRENDLVLLKRSYGELIKALFQKVIQEVPREKRFENGDEAFSYIESLGFSVAQMKGWNSTRAQKSIVRNNGLTLEEKKEVSEIEFKMLMLDAVVNPVTEDDLRQIRENYSVEELRDAKEEYKNLALQVERLKMRSLS